eukprot:TRINITY_DN8238_c0_g1_i2.p1 TRINITY_DN8238_c0_g1~~TRINITY_DN8238_c0_g1_i2.p1  ORF type:complete len:101 (-),score=3.71 TRINITY_DN8238_c0_g1_i2:30-332(-)
MQAGTCRLQKNVSGMQAWIPKTLYIVLALAYPRSNGQRIANSWIGSRSRMLHPMRLDIDRLPWLNCVTYRSMHAFRSRHWPDASNPISALARCKQPSKEI